MARSIQSWFSVVGVLGAMFGLLALSVGDDVRPTGSDYPQGRTAAASVAIDSPFVLPTVMVVANPADLAAADSLEAAERAALAVALVPAPIREAQVQLQKASAASRRVSRVSLRLPYYAFGPDPIGGSN
ncbi:MAG: hypothetical protein ABIP49_09180 [Lysobacterales bacterium]